MEQVIDASVSDGLGELLAERALASEVLTDGEVERLRRTMDEARAHLATNPAHLMQGFWIDQTPPPEWWWREDASGGQVVEQATHIIDLARFLAGDVTEVFGLSALAVVDAFYSLVTTPPAALAPIPRLSMRTVAIPSSARPSASRR